MNVETYISETQNPFYSIPEQNYFIKEENTQKLITEYMDVFYGPYALLDENTERVKLICEMLYATNKYKYDKLYGTLSLEYNPIENYDRNESQTYTKGNTHDGTDTEGAQVITGTHGENNSYVEGAQVNSESGTTSNTTDETNVNLSTTDTNTEDFLNDGKYEVDRTEAGTNSKTQNIGAKTNTDTISRTDSQNIGAKSNTSSFSDEETFTLTSRIHGNVGVTTSQQMVQSEREVAIFNLIAIICADIFESIALPIYD